MNSKFVKNLFGALATSENEVAKRIAVNNMKNLGAMVTETVGEAGEDGIKKVATKISEFEITPDVEKGLKKRVDAMANGKYIGEYGDKPIKDFVTERKEQYLKGLKDKTKKEFNMNKYIFDKLERGDKLSTAEKNFLRKGGKIGTEIDEAGNLKFLQNGIKDFENAEVGVMNDLMYGAKAAKNYMMEPGKKAARWGAYGTVMVGGRLISGGTPLHNNTGERDIAGIPFI